MNEIINTSKEKEGIKKHNNKCFCASTFYNNKNKKKNHK